MRLEILFAVLFISALQGFILGTFGVPWWINGIIGGIIGAIGVIINAKLNN